MSQTRDWLESNPVDHSQFKDQPSHVRAHKVDVSDRLKNLIYGFISGETTEGHKLVKLYAVASPSTSSDAIKIYGKDANSKCEAHLMDEDGNEMQLTKAGAILLSSGKLDNNDYLVSVDSTGTGTVDLIKANASNEPQLPDAVRTATTGAPTEDYHVSNKKYVDDAIAAGTSADSALLGGYAYNETEIKPLGAWVDKSGGYGAQQATTDGFVLVWWTNQASASAFDLAGYTDSASNPTTQRAGIAQTVTASAGSEQFSFMMPVKKSDYWKVVKNSGTGTLKVYWIPLGA